MITSVEELKFDIAEDAFICADCMDLLRQMPDKCIDLAICDPPYGGVTQGGYMKTNESSVLAKNKNYHLSIWGMEKPTQEYFDELQRVSKNQVIWGGNYFASMLTDSQCWLVWDKENGKNDYADCELAWTSFNRATRIFRYRWLGMLQGNMKEKEYRIHPTQKPIALYEWILNTFADKDDLILDTHVGSASSLIACHRTRHRFIGLEIDKEYYRLAKERLETEMSQMTIFDYVEEC